MKTSIFRPPLAILIITALSLTACPTSELEFTSNFVSGISETTVTINWDTNLDDYTSAEISLFPESDLETEPISKTIDNNSERSVAFDRLKGLTKYDYELSLLQGNKVAVSHHGRFRTTYTSERVTLFTRDSLTLKGEISYMSSWDSRVPAIIMMHGWTEELDPWNKSTTMDELIRNGYACLAFFFRGHNSSDQFDLELFKGPETLLYLGCDMEAAIQGLKQYEFIDTTNIGLMGGSMGASAATMGNLFPEVQASVPLGPVNPSYARPITDFFPELAPYHLQTIYYIVGEKDNANKEGWDLAAMTKDLYNATRHPRKIWIIEGSQLHGTRLTTHPGVIDSLTAWFVEQMPSPYSN